MFDQQFESYLFPNKIQRMLSQIFNFMQQQFEIVCFGSKASDRNTFKSVSVTFFCQYIVIQSIQLIFNL